MTSIICGNCKRTHGSVSEVKYCYQVNAGGVVKPVATEQVQIPGLNLSVPAPIDRDRPYSGRRAFVESDGMFKVGETIYKVQHSQTSGRLYAKVLKVDHVGNVHFEYAPGGMKAICEDNRMTLEDAKAFGALYGTCCVCGRTLTDEGSIAAGIGPICAGKQGWAA